MVKRGIAMLKKWEAQSRMLLVMPVYFITNSDFFTDIYVPNTVNAL